MKEDWLLLFDCDGTLVDSEPLLALEMSQAFNEINIPFEPSDYLSRFRGVAFPFILTELTKQYHISLTDERRSVLEKTMRARLLNRMQRELTPIKGIAQALSYLTAFQCYVASNAPLNKIELALEVTHLKPFFEDRIFSGYEMKIWKPDPRFYSEIAKRLNYPINRCIVIDDAAVGLQSALSGGFHAIHYSQRQLKESTPSGAYTLHNMIDLVQQIQCIIHQNSESSI